MVRRLALGHVGLVVLRVRGHVEDSALGSVLEYMTSFHGDEDEAVKSWGEDGSTPNWARRKG